MFFCLRAAKFNAGGLRGRSAHASSLENSLAALPQIVSHLGSARRAEVHKGALHESVGITKYQPADHLRAHRLLFRAATGWGVGTPEPHQPKGAAVSAFAARRHRSLTLAAQ